MNASSKKRANALGYDHDLTTDFLITIAPDVCPIFKQPLTYGGGKKNKFPPSLDRADSSKGYTRDNVQIVSFLANLMKSDANDEEQIMFANWVLSTHGVHRKQ